MIVSLSNGLLYGMMCYGHRLARAFMTHTYHMNRLAYEQQSIAVQRHNSAVTSHIIDAYNSNVSDRQACTNNLAATMRSIVQHM
jgi:hypothetical protein